MARLGYRGRIGIFRVDGVDEDSCGDHHAGEDTTRIPAAALPEDGMRNPQDDGWLKVRNGVTTAVGEVLRVTQEF